MKDKISLAGDLGSGKSTLSKILVERLGMEYYSTGTICREVATRHGISVGEMNKYMETHPELDHEIDDGLAALSEIDRPLLIDSRMAWHFTKGTFRVYLSTDLLTSAARIHAAGRAEEHFESLEEAAEKIRMRQESESRRYLEFYGVSNLNLVNYDLVIDTTHATPEQVADRLCDSFRAWQEDKSYRGCFLSSLRLSYPDEETGDPVRMGAIAEDIEAGVLPVVDVFQDGHEFRVAGDPTVALAYSLTEVLYVPCRLVSPTDADLAREYAPMANSL
jgi:cytidylate kinase